MATSDVPGSNPANNDQLRMGCWAEHKDGSLIFVHSTEGGNVVFSVFDMSKTPIIDYRDSMPLVNFQTQFSWKGTGDRWTWHDKTPFPWDRVIGKGAEAGPRHASAHHTLNAAEEIMESRNRFARAPGGQLAEIDQRTAAQRVADQLIIEGRALDQNAILHRMERTMNRVGGILERLTAAVGGMGKGRSKSGRSTRR